MRLFIAEKPSLAQAIANGLGSSSKKDGYIEINGGQDVVTWCFGHILQQLDPDEYDERYKKWVMGDLPIIPAQWKLKVSPNCAKQFKIIKSLIAKADLIINGGDPDREGQLLIDEVLEYVGNKKTVQRILLNALDDVSVQKALKDLQDNRKFVGLRDSALARSRADWLVGMNLSRAYSIKAQEAGYDLISVGRVQTPTMALVVHREQEIKNFKPTTHYQLNVDWQHPNGIFTTIWQPKENTMGIDPEGRLLDRSVADEILNKVRTVGRFAPPPAKIMKIEKTKKQDAQRLPYSLSALQIDAGQKYGLSPQQVLDTMQELYERKLTTYPRSDCDYLPESQFADAAEVISHLKTITTHGLNHAATGANLSIKSRAWNNKKISAHHAIIPTRVNPNFDSLSELQQKLYYLVAKAYLAQFYPVHTYMATKVWVSCAEAVFTATGKTVLEMGWKTLYQSDDKQQDKNPDGEHDCTIPIMQELDPVQFKDSKIIEKITKPSARFTPSTLLKAMKEIYKYVKDKALQPKLKECSGIGTEATRAGIIDKLQERGFIRLDKKYLVPCDKALMICEVLSEDILFPDTTALWESGLEDIKERHLSLDDFFEQQKGFVEGFIDTAKKLQIKSAVDVVKCPTCGKAMRRRKGKTGFFWGCTGYPDCRTTAPDKKGKPDFAVAKSGGSSGLTATCPKCGKQLRQIKGKFGLFWGCEDRDVCKAMFSDHKDKPVIVKCPTCNKGYLRQKKGKKGVFWSCERYPDCKTIIKDKNGMPDLRVCH